MPGYEVERFVDLSVAEKSELLCSICQEIFREPVVANCCLQSFCQNCIIEWLKSNNTCPYDRKQLTVEDLRPTPRFVTNLLGKLKIRCDNRDRGCEKVIDLQNLNQHMVNCDFNIRECDKCLCVCKVSHDCIQELLANNRKAVEENLNLRTSQMMLTDRMDENHTEIITLKAEKENLLKTIEELTELGRDAQISKNALTEARLQITSPVSVQHNISSDVSEQIIEVVVYEMLIKSKLMGICANIVRKLENKFGDNWICFANNNNFGYAQESYHQDKYEDELDLYDYGRDTVRPLTKRETKALIFETYNDCINFGESNVKQIIRNEYFARPLSCDILFQKSKDNKHVFTIINDDKEVLSAVTLFEFEPELNENEIRLISRGEVIAGDLIGAKVKKLKVYDRQQVETDCSQSPGLLETTYAYEEIHFETHTKANKFICVGKLMPGYSEFYPGMMFSSAIEAEQSAPDIVDDNIQDY